MSQNWKNLEVEVRRLAAVIWRRPFSSENVHGRQIDAYSKEPGQASIAIEVTQKKDIRKLQEDINKLVHVRNVNFSSEYIMTTCVVVTEYDPTEHMRSVARTINVDLYSISEFRTKFLPFEAYRTARKSAPFGSAADPQTGDPDTRNYIKVDFNEGGRVVSNDTLLGSVLGGKKVVVIGEYGSGKSKFSEHAFDRLGERARQTGIFPIAIDLRKCWGLTDRYEIIRRHLKEMNMSDHETAFVNAYNAKMLCVLLDGFDEVGSQSWSDDADGLRNLRASALAGVRDLITNQRGGLLISGRDHYFDSNLEMLSSLGLNDDDVTVVETKQEFSPEEVVNFLKDAGYKGRLPSWLPKKPLTCEFYIRSFNDGDDEIDEVDGPVEFWDHYFKKICERESKLNSTFDTDSISKVLVSIAAVTRQKPENVGPISLTEIREAFERAVGYTPIDQASVLLQRLSGLGRASSDSEDRRFVDTYLLEGLRAQNVIDVIRGVGDPSIFNSDWINPLSEHGANICAQKVSDLSLEDDALGVCKTVSLNKNKTLYSDIVCSVVLSSDEVDSSGLEISDAYVGFADFSRSLVQNLHFNGCIFSKIILPVVEPHNLDIVNCSISLLAGVSQADGMPKWIRNSSVDNFTSLETTSRIRASSVSPGQKVLLAIIHKTFFQPGSARKEEALFRGLGKVADPKVVTQIVKKLLSEGVLSEEKGDTGRIYVPQRSQTRRVGRITAELSMSKDELWLFAGETA